MKLFTLRRLGAVGLPGTRRGESPWADRAGHLPRLVVRQSDRSPEPCGHLRAPARRPGFRLPGWLQLALLALLALPAAALAQVTVVFEADLRPLIAAGRFDVDRDGVGLRGGQPPLSWQRSLAMQPLGDGRYTLAVPFPSTPFGGQAVQHKFRIERPGQRPDDGWEPGRNHLAWPAGAAPRVARRFGADAEPAPRHIAGDVESLGILASRQVAPRPVQVWLPPGYGESPRRRYAVLYLHDGQNLFDASAAGAEWQVDETAQRLVAAGAVEPMIVVAVHSGPDRLTDYTPSAGLPGPAPADAAAARPVGGGAAAYARFLVDELKPLIDARYRTRAEPACTAVGGSSLGGLVSLWLALHHGGSFGAALVVSPSLWWDQGFALRELRRLADAELPGPPRPRLWLDIGAQEGASAVQDVRALRAALLERGWTPNTLAYLEQADGGHDEASWAARVERMLRFLYGRGGGAGAAQHGPVCAAR